MRKIPTFLALLFTFNTFAGSYRAEFDPTQEIKCHQEMITVGCVVNGEENITCAEQKKEKLSKDCQSIQAAKKRNL